MTDEAAEIPRDKLTPSLLAADAMCKLLNLFEEWLPQKTDGEFILGMIQSMWEDDRTNGDALLNASFQSSSNEEERDSGFDLFIAISAAFAYCVQAMKADAEGNSHEAWICASDALLWLGILSAYWVAEKRTKSKALKGAKGRDANYEPLRKFARDLAKEKSFPSRRNAAMSIAPQVLELSNQLGVNMSPSQAHTTISNWLAGITFGGKRRT